MSSQHMMEDVPVNPRNINCTLKNENLHNHISLSCLTICEDNKSFYRSEEQERKAAVQGVGRV